jgi:hypothetical protein
MLNETISFSGVAGYDKNGKIKKNLRTGVTNDADELPWNTILFKVQFDCYVSEKKAQKTVQKFVERHLRFGIVKYIKIKESAATSENNIAWVFVEFCMFYIDSETNRRFVSALERMSNGEICEIHILDIVPQKAHPEFAFPFTRMEDGLFIYPASFGSARETQVPLEDMPRFADTFNLCIPNLSHELCLSNSKDGLHVMPNLTEILEEWLQLGKVKKLDIVDDGNKKMVFAYFEYNVKSRYGILIRQKLMEEGASILSKIFHEDKYTYFYEDTFYNFQYWIESIEKWIPSNMTFQLHIEESCESNREKEKEKEEKKEKEVGNTQLEERCVQLEERCVQLEERCVQLEERYAQLEEHHTQLEKRHTQLVERHAQLEERNAQMEERNAQMEEQLKEIYSELKKEATTIGQLEADVDALITVGEEERDKTKFCIRQLSEKTKQLQKFQIYAVCIVGAYMFCETWKFIRF